MPSSPERNRAPMAFMENRSSAVCLPLLTGRKQLMWVRSDQMDLGADGGGGGGELDEAFDRFPYLTRKEAAALARRCSLHPDQVKVWFMAQRLRYGISWEREDIASVRKKFKSEERRAQGRMEAAGHKDGVAKKRKKEKMSVKKVRERDKGGETMQEQSIKDEKEVQNIPVVGVGRKTLTGKVRKKRAKHDDEEKIEEREFERIMAECKANGKKKRKKKKAAKVKNDGASHNGLTPPPDPPVDRRLQSVVQLENHAEDASLLTDDLSELLKGIDLSSNDVTAELDTIDHDTFYKTRACLDAGDPLAFAQQPKPGVPSPSSPKEKKQTQTAMMRTAFLRCQYPDRRQYASMAALIGVSHVLLVQWFNDMRYYIKKAKPRWMSHGQHQQTVANIRYRQYLSSLSKEEKPFILST